MRNMFEEEFENECLENDNRIKNEKAVIQKELIHRSGEYTVKDYLFKIKGGFADNSRITDFWSNYIFKNGLPVHHFYQYDDREKTPETLQKELMNYVRVTNKINSRY